MSAYKVERHGDDAVVLRDVERGYDAYLTDGALTIYLPDRVGLVEALLDALTDDERAGVREYLDRPGGAS